MAKARSDKYDINLLANEFEAIKIQKDGQVSFSGFPFGEFLTVLETSIGFSEKLPEAERMRIIREAVFAVGAKGKITGRSLLGQVSRLEKSYLDSAAKPYVLVTSVSVKPHFIEIPRVTLNGCSLTFSRTLPERFNLEPLAEFFRLNGHIPLLRDYLVTRIRVRARSQSEAFETAIWTLDLLRGIWNLGPNRSITSRVSSGRPKPINPIRLGPVHTLHEPSGRLARDEGYWYEALFSDRDGPADLRRNWTTIKRNERRLRRRLASSSYGPEISQSLVRYARALDGTDFESSFLKLWSLLEFLTDTGRSPYDRTIDRCLFRVKDRELERQVLEHLREQRNASVHLGEPSERFEALVFQLKRYVEDLLVFHLWSDHSSIAEAAAFLDLPHDPSMLKKRIAAYRRALSFRSRL